MLGDPEALINSSMLNVSTCISVQICFCYYIINSGIPRKTIITLLHVYDNSFCGHICLQIIPSMVYIVVLGIGEIFRSVGWTDISVTIAIQ